MPYPGVDSRSASTAYSTKRNIHVPLTEPRSVTVLRNDAAAHDTAADPTGDAGYVKGTAGTSPTSVPPDVTTATNVNTETHNVAKREV